MYELDASVTQAINSLAGANTAIDSLMVWVSAIGVPLLVLAVAGQWWVRNERTHTRHILIATGFSFLVGLALNQLILLFIHRMRPYDAGLTHLLVSPAPTIPFHRITRRLSLPSQPGFSCKDTGGAVLLSSPWRR